MNLKRLFMILFCLLMGICILPWLYRRNIQLFRSLKVTNKQYVSFIRILNIWMKRIRFKKTKNYLNNMAAKEIHQERKNKNICQ